MWIGAGRIVLDFYNNDDLALKHRKLEELCTDLRRKFNLSMLEVAELEDTEKCVLGFAAVMPATWKEAAAHSLTAKIAKTVDELAFARVMVEDLDLFWHGGEELDD